LLIPFSVSPVYLFTCIPITVPSVYLFTGIPITVPIVYLLNLSELKQEKGELVDGQHVLSQPIWLNPLIKISGNMCMNKICGENGAFFVNDLISENKMLFTCEEFKIITIILD
jgi:hypothetical protein